MNLNVRKQFLSSLTAFVLMFTPIMAQSETAKEETSNTQEVEFKLVKQSRKDEKQTMTVSDFENLVKNSLNYTRQFFDYPDMQKDLHNVCYLLNRVYLKENTEQELISMGYVTPIDMQNGMFDSIISAQCFNNVRGEYDESMIRETEDLSKLFDISVLCYDESDKEALHEMFNLWVKAHLNNNFDQDSAYELFKMLTSLNSAEGKRQACDLQPGAEFFAKFAFGLDLRRAILDYMSDNYSIDELSLYYDKSDLVRHQFTRNDRETDTCTILGYLVDICSEIEVHCLENSLNNLMKSFDKSCGTLDSIYRRNAMEEKAYDYSGLLQYNEKAKVKKLGEYKKNIPFYQGVYGRKAA